MKIIITLLLFLGTTVGIFAQTDFKGRPYKTCYYKETTLEMGDITIYFTDIVANDAYMKMKVRVKNNSGDFVLFDLNSITVTAGGNTYKPNETALLIDPLGNESRVVDIKGPDFRVASYTINIDGLSKVPAVGKFTEAPNFKLPVAVNDFAISNYRAVHLNNDRKTDQTAVKFAITYIGSNVGIFNPAKVTLKMSKGNQYANMNPNRKPRIITPNETMNFTFIWSNIGVANGDMQFDNMELLWKDAFMEAKATKLVPKTVTLAFDPGLTDGKN